MPSPRHPVPDIFHLLGIPRRELSHTKMLTHAIDVSDRLRTRLIELALPGAPALEIDEVAHCRTLHQGGIVDIWILGHDRTGATYAVFIEVKIDDTDSRSKTRDYLAAARAVVGAADRAGGIYLTLDGSRSIDPDVRVLRHRDLGQILAEVVDDFTAYPDLRLVLETYSRRACAPEPAPAGHTLLRELLDEPADLLPRQAGVRALAQAIAGAAGPGWTARALRIQGRGHGTDGIQFAREGWRGTPIVGQQWRPDNLDIHLEVEIVDGELGLLKVHFETCPYRTRDQIDELAGAEDFARARDAFRTALHARASSLPSWRMTRRPLQAATCEPDADDTVGGVAAAYGAALADIVLHVEHALAVTRAALR